MHGAPKRDQQNASGFRRSRLANPPGPTRRLETDSDAFEPYHKKRPSNALYGRLNRNPSPPPPSGPFNSNFSPSYSLKVEHSAPATLSGTRPRESPPVEGSRTPRGVTTTITQMTDRLNRHDRAQQEENNTAA